MNSRAQKRMQVYSLHQTPAITHDSVTTQQLPAPFLPNSRNRKNSNMESGDVSPHNLTSSIMPMSQHVTTLTPADMSNNTTLRESKMKQNSIQSQNKKITYDLKPNIDMFSRGGHQAARLHQLTVVTNRYCDEPI